MLKKIDKELNCIHVATDFNCIATDLAYKRRAMPWFKLTCWFFFNIQLLLEDG
jgi:hypothetical protein